MILPTIDGTSTTDAKAILTIGHSSRSLDFSTQEPGSKCVRFLYSSYSPQFDREALKPVFAKIGVKYVD